MSHEADRFAFGANWLKFLNSVTEPQLDEAVQHLSDMLGRDRLDGLSFLDIGSGSGLMSLAARRLGARVHSFDYDTQSVAGTALLRDRFAAGDEQWTVERGSALDADYMQSLGSFDVVYSWGVLHHTGDMWRALELTLATLAPGGLLYIALYNDQGAASRRWTRVKRAYNRASKPGRAALLTGSVVRLWGPTLLKDSLRGNPLATWRGGARERGMTPWRDLVDWVGGYPFEVATPDDVVDFSRRRGLTLRRLRTCGGGLGCNEFVLEAPPTGT